MSKPAAARQAPQGGQENSGAAQRFLASLDTESRAGLTSAARADLPGSVDDVPPTDSARIVIVDDEPLGGTDLEAFLRSIGYRQVLRIMAAADTLDALRGARPDLVLLDLGLRAPTAFDVLSGLHADRVLCHVPVIAMTEQDDRATRLQALELGAADYLVKPIDASDLELRLRNTLARKALHDRLAKIDHLTGLPNRDSALHQLDWALKFASRHDGTGAVLQIGLGRFKQINDALGPALGDELLRAVSLRLLNCLRDTDLATRDAAQDVAASVSRGDGDEFTVLLPAMGRAGDASVVATRIVESMSGAFVLAGHELFVSCQVGIAVFPGDSLDRDIVLRQAKLAMSHARAAGDAAGSSVRFYSNELNERAAGRLAVERELHHALERGELVLHFQPKVDVGSGRITGAEALVRWQHPKRGLLGPGAFIEVAEESGLIVPLGDWVLRQALRQVGAWRRAGLPPVAMAVNVSSLQLRRPHLDLTVADALADAGVDGRALCLELTESVMMETGTHVTRALRAIKDLGVRLSLDDFGTGYSSLSHLRSFPIDELKIDRSFIVECHSANNSAAIITQTIIAMAHGLRLTVVAEGIETASQLAFVRDNACDEFQGHLFSKALPAADFEALLRLGGASIFRTSQRQKFG